MNNNPPSHDWRNLRAYPRLMYHQRLPDEHMRVHSPEEEAALDPKEWGRVPMPEPPPVIVLDPLAELQAQVAALTARVEALEKKPKK